MNKILIIPGLLILVGSPIIAQDQNGVFNGDTEQMERRISEFPEEEAEFLAMEADEQWQAREHMEQERAEVEKQMEHMEFQRQKMGAKAEKMRASAERMDMMVMWRLTDLLELTEEQATTFFPAYRSYRETVESLEKRERELAEAMREKLLADEEISEKDYKSTVDDLEKIRRQRMDEESAFLKSTEDYLSPRQRVRLAFAQQRFKAELRRHIMERQHRERPERFNPRPDRPGHRP